MPLRILTWNLKHGRAVPSAGRNLFGEFAAALSGWEWDLALLQEVPPWWPKRLATEHALGLTSRNLGLPARRFLAERWPDAIKSGGGGCNATLVRRHHIVRRRTLRLRWLPERRWLLGIELDIGLWVGNLHASGRGIAEVARAAESLTAWAGGAPAVLGGDFNLSDLTLPGVRVRRRPRRRSRAAARSGGQRTGRGARTWASVRSRAGARPRHDA